MPWPTAQDYNEAVQNPAICFYDPVLKSGRAELTSLGLPKPITGGFASVYRMECQQRSWAVRCFLREFTDQEERYTEISSHLAAAKLRYTVEFEFQKKGILVGGRWFPILKMEWVRGKLLNNFIADNLKQPQILSHLAKRWILMTQALQMAGISHGDLQHGNVVVVDGDIKLIDYDGMFVPKLAGRTSNEVGHRNYQHPLRMQSDYGSFTDNFSAWVVYVSLLILSVDTSLWKQLGSGDEFIIFHKEDFASPNQSKTFRLLESHSDPRIHIIADAFKALLYLPVDQVPAIDGRSMDISSGVAQSIAKLPEWLAPHVQSDRQCDDANNGTQAKTGVFWLFDCIESDTVAGKREFKLSFPYRVANTLLVVVCGTLIVLFPTWDGLASYLGIANPAYVIATGVALFYCAYATRPELGERRTAKRACYTQEAEILRLEAIIAKQDSEDIVMRRQVEQERGRILERVNALRQQEAGEINTTNVKHREVVASIASARMAVNQSEAAALKKLHDETQYGLRALSQQITNVRQNEIAEAARQLQRLQDDHLRNLLMRHHIANATISGIGPALSSRLARQGIYTAADISKYRVMAVTGIGWNKGRALVEWRDALTTHYQANIPTKLPPVEADAIRRKFQSQISQLQSQHTGLEARTKQAEQDIRGRHAKERESLSRAEVDSKKRAESGAEAVAMGFAPKYAAAARELSVVVQRLEESAKAAKQRQGMLGKQMFSARWRLMELKKQFARYSALTMRNYIVSLLG